MRCYYIWTKDSARTNDLASRFLGNLIAGLQSCNPLDWLPGCCVHVDFRDVAILPSLSWPSSVFLGGQSAETEVKFWPISQVCVLRHVCLVELDNQILQTQATLSCKLLETDNGDKTKVAVFSYLYIYLTFKSINILLSPLCFVLTPLTPGHVLIATASWSIPGALKSLRPWERMNWAMYHRQIADSLSHAAFQSYCVFRVSHILVLTKFVTVFLCVRLVVVAIGSFPRLSMVIGIQIYCWNFLYSIRECL